MEEVNYSYFQYHRDNQYPIYLRFEADYFDNEILSFLSSMCFKELTEKESSDVMNTLSVVPNSRLLTLLPASNSVAGQIRNTVSTDQFGLESVFPKDGYRVYRFKSIGMIVYSSVASEWEAGVFSNFGSQEHVEFYRAFINRYLSWALAPLGVVGFWGVPVDEGIVVQNQRQSLGEVVFIDVRKKKILSLDGVRRSPIDFKVLRLDSHLKDRNLKMVRDQLASFLSTHTSYIDPKGHSVAVRQLIQEVAKSAEGIVHPEESFKPRANLSL